MKRHFLYQITAASRTPDYGATAPISLLSLSSTKIVEPPPPPQNPSVRHCLAECLSTNKCACIVGRNC